MIKVVLAGMESPALAHLRRWFASTDGVRVEGQVPLAPEAAAFAQRAGAAVLVIYWPASTGDTFDVIRRIRGMAPVVADADRSRDSAPNERGES